MKLMQTQRTIEDVALEAPLEDLEVLNALNDYLNFRGTRGPHVLSGSQIDLLLQNMIQRANSDSWRMSSYINQLINTSIEAGNDQFVLHTGDFPMNYLLRGVGTFSRRSRITVHGNVGDEFACTARNVDVTVYGDCVDVGSHANDSSFVVHGNIADDAIFRSVSTRLIAHGSVNGSVAEEAHDFNAEIHGGAGVWSGYRAKNGVLTLHSSYGDCLGHSAKHCTFRVKKEHYHGEIGQPDSSIGRLFSRNKVVFI